MRKQLLNATLFLTVGILSLGAVSLIGDEHESGSKLQNGPRIFEQRVYTTAEGKLPNLHARFRNHTNYLFVKHGMHLIGYWTPNDKPNTLVYILAYPSKEAREESWKGFMGDPEWQTVWAKSKEDAGGPIVTNVESTFMTPTDYSPMQ